MVVNINSNVAALNAQRRLSENTRALDQTFQRLSSGLRINRASDDASGLAISQLLNADARVFVQGVRNFSDGLALLNIAEGALTQASNIVIRIRELATQSANGVLTYSQRKALHQEADSLVKEFNRIVTSIEYNNTKILDGSLTSLRLQGSYGSDGQIAVSLGEDLGRAGGTGILELTQLFDTSYLGNITFGDFNGDGIIDGLQMDEGEIRVFFGNGDGTFYVGPTSAVSSEISLNMVQLDLNGDGFTDLIGPNNSDTTQILMFFGNGDGTFLAPTTIDLGAGIWSNEMKLHDINQDGNADIVFANGSSIFTLLGNSDGTFASPISSHIGISFGNNPHFVDINNDGILDYLGTSGSSIAVSFGSANGSFSAAESFEVGKTIGKVAVADFNRDGTLDIIFNDHANKSEATVLFGNGDGTFLTGATFAIANGTPIDVSIYTDDFDGDGIQDFYASSVGTDSFSQFFLGNGDGTFRTSDELRSNTYSAPLIDLNNDGIIDFFGLDLASSEFGFFLNKTEITTTLPFIDLHTRKNALDSMPVIDAALERITGELGNIGSAQSRVSTAISVLQQSNENFRAAASRIVDADIADESAQLVRTKILQEAAASVLAQANLLPEIALTLLKD